ncbi:uncharacterized protein LOC110275627 [Arachis duranensis]|uniref:Uncharacterized protein n=2 Tax=Arachis TaxID=3817 RepID=A0A445EQS8_ARAHY|nr:uncharacterized protein LOC110275627 [Arachis duranensis]RYR77741.1 hypothetical protein Ahy_A01g002333 [Arachis hypogaea]
MAETSKKNRKNRKNKKKRNIAIEYKCSINLLPCDIWVRIATKNALNSIQDLFNMQATCKVFLDAASSDAVYKHTSMLELLTVSFLYYFDRPEKRFPYCCAEAENMTALLRVGMMDFF